MTSKKELLECIHRFTRERNALETLAQECFRDGIINKSDYKTIVEIIKN